MFCRLILCLSIIYASTNEEHPNTSSRGHTVPSNPELIPMDNFFRQNADVNNPVFIWETWMWEILTHDSIVDSPSALKLFDSKLKYMNEMAIDRFKSRRGSEIPEFFNSLKAETESLLEKKCLSIIPVLIFKVQTTDISLYEFLLVLKIPTDKFNIWLGNLTFRNTSIARKMSS